MRRRTEAKRNAILKVARELFSQKGYQNTSMSELTERVGGSKATIYGYFKSKKLLFQAVMEGDSLAGVSLKAPASDDAIQIIPLENHRQIIAIVNAMTNSHDSVKKTLYRFSKNVMQTVCQPAFLEIYKLAVGSSSKSGIGPRFFETGPLYLFGKVQEYLQSCKDKGLLDLKDVERAASDFLALMRGPVFERYLFGYEKAMTSLDIQRKTRRSVDTFLKIYGPEKTGG